MKKDKNIPVIFAATFYLICYILLLSSDATVQYGILMFSISPLVLIWTVTTVLKQENKSRKTFDEYLYEDVDERRS